MELELFRKIMFGMLAFALPLATYIAYLDLVDWYKNRSLLSLARCMTRIGWVLSLGAVAARWSFDLQPIGHAGLAPLAPIFFSGLTLSCFGFLGVAINYHKEKEKK